MLSLLSGINFKLDNSNGKSQWDCRVVLKITFGKLSCISKQGHSLNTHEPDLLSFAKTGGYIFTFITTVYKIQATASSCFSMK
jgi:hypothetical protein